MADGRLFGNSDTSLINLDDSCIYCNNIVKHLSIIDKGKLKWNGSLENLIAFMDKLLERKTLWTSTGGDYKRLELVNSIIRWYYKNGLLTIPGEESDDLKSQLRTIADYKNSINEAHSSGGSGEKDDDGILVMGNKT